MADLLRITTPILDKNQQIQAKPGADPVSPFNIQDVNKVIQTHNQSEILKQNTGSLENDAPSILMNLLKDPSVTVSYLKNIFLLEEIVKLLPANNATVTQEIEQFFQTLLIQSDEIVPEMKKQEQASTMFHGEIFDFLRQMINENPEHAELQWAVATVLKAINNLMAKEDILDAVANSLGFLMQNLKTSKSLSEKLETLIDQYRQKGASANFEELKAQTMQLLKEIEDSILFTPKLSKIVSIIIYNLSRHHDDSDYLFESAYYLRQFLTPQQRHTFSALLQQFPKQWEMIKQSEEEKSALNSKVMDALTSMVKLQSHNEKLSYTDAEKIEKIIHSLLSSPCNFTPLLHFVVPGLHAGMRAFAEVWINPNSDEKDMPKGVGKGKHFLLVIDVEGIGRFELELFVYGNSLDIHLYCPKGYEKPYRNMLSGLPKVLGDFPYRLQKMELYPLEKPRSLMEVFKSLPYKRVGVDVKI